MNHISMCFFSYSNVNKCLDLCPLHKQTVDDILDPVEDSPYLIHSLLSTIFQIEVKQEGVMQVVAYFEFVAHSLKRNPFEKFIGVRTMYHSNIYKLTESSSYKESEPHG
jgi:hypothetical protein